MGLFGSKNKDEINIKMEKGRIKAILSRSFFGGCELSELLEGDTLRYGASNGLSCSLNRKLSFALGEWDGGACDVTISRYGNIEVSVVLGKQKTAAMQGKIQFLCDRLIDKGYDAFWSTYSDQTAVIVVTKAGFTGLDYEMGLTKMLNDVAMEIIDKLQHIQ